MDFYTFFILFASGLSIIMAVGLMMRPLLYRNILFSIILISIAYFNILVYLVYIGKIWEYPAVIFLKIPVSMFIGPLIYFYMLSHIKDKLILNVRDWFHFFAPLIFTLVLMFYMDQSVFEKLRYRNSLFENKELLFFNLAEIISIGFITVYIFLSIRSIVGRIKSGNPVHQRILIFLIILIIGLIITIVSIIAMLTRWEYITQLNGILVSVLIISLFLLSQRYPYLLQHGTIGINKKVQSKSHLSRVDLQQLNKQLAVLMEKEKFFCDEDLTLKRLSDALEVTPHQLSEFLNEHHNKNFNSFINTYRVNEAKSLLIEEPNRNALSIAYSIGFNSYSAFHSSFKKETNMSPADFRRVNLKNNKAASNQVNQ